MSIYGASNAREFVLLSLLLLRLALSRRLSWRLGLDFFGQLLLFLVALFFGDLLEELFALLEFLYLGVNFLGRGRGKQSKRFEHSLHFEWDHELLFSLTRLLFLFLLLLILLLRLLVFFWFFWFQNFDTFFFFPLNVTRYLGVDLLLSELVGFFLFFFLLGAIILKIFQVGD